MPIYKTVILPLTLRGCEICPYTAAQNFGYQRRVFHNRVTRIFGLKMGRIAEPDKLLTTCGRKRMTNRQDAKNEKKLRVTVKLINTTAV